MGGFDSQTGTVGSFGQALLPSLGEAFADLERHGWFVLTDLRQPGRSGACIDAVLVGPGGVVVLDSSTRKQSMLSSVSAAVVALVPAEVRRHVQAIVCPPAERGDSGAVSVKPSVLAGFVQSLPQVMTAQRAADVAQGLRDTLAGPLSAPLWTVSKVLEWTKDAKGTERSQPNRRSRRSRRRGETPSFGWTHGLARHAALVCLMVTAFVLIGVLAH